MALASSIVNRGIELLTLLIENTAYQHIPPMTAS